MGGGDIPLGGAIWAAPAIFRCAERYALRREGGVGPTAALLCSALRATGCCENGPVGNGLRAVPNPAAWERHIGRSLREECRGGLRHIRP